MPEAAIVSVAVDMVLPAAEIAPVLVRLSTERPPPAARCSIPQRLIREAAFTHNCYATFMAKPLANEPGSAMHIHQSVVDVKTGRNVFTVQ